MRKSSRVHGDWCGECICRYCRWYGTDNCLNDEKPPCDRCKKGSKTFYVCDGFTKSPTGRKKKDF